MTHNLTFSQKYVYDPREAAITVPLLLKAGQKKVELLANVDTGASYCLFEHGYAEALLIDVESGQPQSFTTANSSLQAYGHEISIHVLGFEFEAIVYFFGDPKIRKNVLGRHGWLNRIRLGLVDHDLELNISSYNE